MLTEFDEIGTECLFWNKWGTKNCDEVLNELFDIDGVVNATLELTARLIANSRNNSINTSIKA